MNSPATARAETPLRRTALLPPALAALTGVAVIFVLFELADRVWLREHDPELTYWFHFARGVVSSFAAALIVGLLMYRGTRLVSRWSLPQ